MKRVIVASCVAVVVAAAAAFTVPIVRAADDSADPPAAAPAAPEPSAKDAKVRKLLKLTGAEESAKQVMDAMMGQFRAMPGLPKGFVEKFQAKCDAKQIVELSVPFYLKHFDEPTLDAAIVFYELAAGRKFLAEQPALLAETMAAGEEWGRKLAMEIMEELGAEDGPK